uniref:ribosomal protein S17 n=1 Tax=Polyopes affinis TaxID=194519 RepID=UPI002A81699E|nr:ribosomal protein S17 [Polyopes affinis]WOL37060.1 ribosomal protein S17 [Polyopes affinis]
MPRKQNTGTVISNRMNKTIIVTVKTKVAHKKYNKVIAKTNKYYVHDENNECMIGDQVRIEEFKPISKNKRWILKEKIT